jgi:hypothetical protein
VFPLLLAVLKKIRQYTELFLVRRPSELVVVVEEILRSEKSVISKSFSI